MPQSLIMYASRHPSRWRAEFLPALLAPMAREAAYFSLPLDQRDARDRLIGAIQMNVRRFFVSCRRCVRLCFDASTSISLTARCSDACVYQRALHLSKARVEEYQQSCHELGTTGVLISASQANARLLMLFCCFFCSLAPSQATAADVFVAELRRQWSSSRAVAAHLAGWNALPSDGDREQVVALIGALFAWFWFCFAH